MFIPSEDFVKGESDELYPSEMVWRWINACEVQRVPGAVGTPPVEQKVEIKATKGIAGSLPGHADTRYRCNACRIEYPPVESMLRVTDPPS